MRKMIAAATVGLLLVAGQAAAAGSNGAAARVGDRVSAELGASSDWGVPRASRSVSVDRKGSKYAAGKSGGAFVWPFVIGIGAIWAFTEITGNNDSSDSE